MTIMFYTNAPLSPTTNHAPRSLARLLHPVPGPNATVVNVATQAQETILGWTMMTMMKGMREREGEGEREREKKEKERGERLWTMRPSRWISQGSCACLGMMGKGISRG
jgi:hypothetical protein